jgi:hypothetical protein
VITVLGDFEQPLQGVLSISLVSDSFWLFAGFVYRVEDAHTVAVNFCVKLGETDIVLACCFKLREISLAKEKSKKQGEQCCDLEGKQMLQDMLSPNNAREQ